MYICTGFVRAWTVIVYLGNQSDGRHCMEDVLTMKLLRVVLFQHLPGWKIAKRVKLTGCSKNMPIVRQCFDIEHSPV